MTLTDPLGTRGPAASHALLLIGVRDLSVVGGLEVGDARQRGGTLIVPLAPMKRLWWHEGRAAAGVLVRDRQRHQCRLHVRPRCDRVASGVSAQGLVEHPLLVFVPCRNWHLGPLKAVV